MGGGGEEDDHHPYPKARHTPDADILRNLKKQLLRQPDEDPCAHRRVAHTRANYWFAYLTMFRQMIRNHWKNGLEVT